MSDSDKPSPYMQMIIKQAEREGRSVEEILEERRLRLQAAKLNDKD